MVKPHRTKLPESSHQMKAWSAALAAGIGEWPQVTMQSFLGFTALYRQEKLFGLLPRTRGMQTANSLVFKLPVPSPRILARLQQDSRVAATVIQKRAGSPLNFPPMLICGTLSSGSDGATKGMLEKDTQTFNKPRLAGRVPRA